MSWTPSPNERIVYVQQPPPAQKARFSWKSKIALGLISLGIVTLVLWYLRRTLDPVTKGILSGAACGVLASIPGGIGLAILLDRRRRIRDQKEQPATSGMPANNAWNPHNPFTAGPVVIYTGVPPMGSQPTRPLDWTEGEMKRRFRVLGPPADADETELKLWDKK